MCKLLRIICITFIMLIIPVAANASCNILIDGKELICYNSAGVPVSSFVENGTTYVPVRAIAEAFNISVFWEQDTKTVFLVEKSGTPTLGENINIYYNGKKFICHDVTGAEVYPIIIEGTTYLPIRAIGELLGKNVEWDNASQTAILTTPLSSDSYSYLLNAISNTDNAASLTQELTFSGTMYHNESEIATISESENISYSPSTFSLSSVIDPNQIKNAAYLGNGEYFILAASSRFATAPYIIDALMNSKGETNFSLLYITLSAKSGYVTDISLKVNSTLTYNGITFYESFNITSDIIYPQSFVFPHIPYPDDNENSVFSQDAADAAAISETVTQYIDFAFNASSVNMAEMLYSADYDLLFSNKSKNQQDLVFNTISKKLASIYKYATGDYTVSSMVYLKDPETYRHSPEKVAKITLEINCSDGAEEWVDDAEIILIQINGAWYLSHSTIEALM